MAVWCTSWSPAGPWKSLESNYVLPFIGALFLVAYVSKAQDSKIVWWRFRVLRGRRQGLGHRWILIMCFCSLVYIIFLAVCASTARDYNIVLLRSGVLRGRLPGLGNRWILIVETVWQARQGK